ncbi:TolC family protein [Ilyobacter polytropus]|uniref:Outer membrane efflux protein n=1 Tax=Ilyobacter polytropus (strain ATCC 51220 / DSM 2926 / LMG 16218 / CuHBu1) TaxID=572544 RepID=E3H8M6_ILYPC|nr:TolC family protein [Ilyobacter polytropus]ADO83008.1 outer membrane efflux protein [Ilyobacter polytropus DSM 2926]
MKRRVLVFFLTFGIFLMSFGKEVGIGVIYGDKPKEVNEHLKITLEKELWKNFENTQFDPVIKKEVTVFKKDIKDIINKLQNDSNIDAIISLDINLPENMKSAFDKLVIVPFFHGNNENIKNLNLISTDYNFKEILEMLTEIKDMEKLGIVYSGGFENTARKYKEKIISEKIFDKENINIISLDESQEKYIADILENDGLIIVSDKNIVLKKAVARASEKKIPSFSLFFRSENSANVFMGYSLKEIQERSIRAAAVNLLKYCEGREFSEMTTKLDSENLNIFLDYKVAQVLDLYPGDFLTEKIRMVNESEIGTVKLSLKDALYKLFENNTELKSKKQDLVSSSYDVKIAKAALKPNLTATFDYDKQDNTRARLYSTGAENSLQVGGKISQTLYDESTFSNITIQKKLYDAVKGEMRGKEISQIQSLIEAYLGLLKSKSRFEIEKYNMNLVKRYLSLAKTKYSIGSGGPEDVYRFESELADSVTNLEDIKSDILSGNSELNRLLGSSMDTYFSLSEDGIGDIIGFYLFRNFENELNKPWKFDKIKNYFIEQGLENSSEIKSMDAKIAAKERELKAAKRKRYVPTVTASGNYDRDVVDPWGTGSDNSDSDEYWNAGVGFSIPIYKGGELTYTKKQLEAELDKLKLDRKTMVSEISKNISSQYAKVSAAYRKIRSAEKSAESSRKNLKLKTELYVKGKITITDMLDARNSLIGAEQKKTSVKFDFFISQAMLEKLCGKYYFENSSDEKEIEFENIKDIITSK